MADIRSKNVGAVEIVDIIAITDIEANKIEVLGRDKDELRCIFHRDRSYRHPWLEIRKEVP